ncbi:hypothetical protein [uncultured Methylibium sp.]|uniref:hypothetical protein n=1 Tax=uncultured Methylibium sp. TaxID=381093 RepID=UPI0025CF8DED|nr:hypothetical protein [uncultured Methylibium sp.]
MTHRRWGAALLAFAAMVAVVLVAWRFDSGAPPDPAAAAAPVPADVPTWLSLPRTSLEVAEGAPAVPATVPPTAPGCESLPDADLPAALPARGAQLIDRSAVARGDLLLRLAAQPEERVRAAGLVLQARFAVMEQQNEPVAACASPPCWLPEPAAQRTAREALARLASGSHDPVVHALAVETCREAANWPAARGGPRRDETCGLVSAEQWARLDADNAYPWLFVAEAARQRRDTAAHGEAMHRIANARASDAGYGRVHAIVAPYLPDDLPPLAQMGLDGSVLGVTASQPLAPYQAALGDCKDDGLRDVNRRQTCEGIARLLTERAGSLLELGLGLGLARRLEWPPDRIDALTRERDAYQQAAAEAMKSTAGSSLCGMTRRLASQVEGIGREGELAWMRRWVAQSGLTVDELAARRRADNEPADPAASAASK